MKLSNWPRLTRFLRLCACGGTFTRADDTHLFWSCWSPGASAVHCRNGHLSESRHVWQRVGAWIGRALGRSGPHF